MALSVTNYHTVQGRIFAERNSSTRDLDYLTDALGSVTELRDPATQSSKASVRYLAYGKRSSTSASVSLPKNLWVGAYGYRRTGRWRSDLYIRARHLGLFASRWTSIDPLWPRQSAYLYGDGNPITVLDFFGLQTGHRIRRRTGRNSPKHCKSYGHTPSCFFCAYHAFRSSETGAYLSCKLANQTCGTHMPCGPCGPFEIPDFGPTPCINNSLNDWLRHSCGNSGLRGDPGGGDDKLAHCYAVCAAMDCFGPGYIFWEAIRSDEEGDVAAERAGEGCNMNSCLDCITCCAQATAAMPRNDWQDPPHNIGIVD